MMDELPILLYTTPEGAVKVKAVLKDETMWLTQAGMADLFDVAPQNITYHLKKIYASGELSEAATCKEILQVQNEGAREIARNLKFYNLDAAISVGYRINSAKATQFRIWATGVLKEFIVKGFVLDDDRLKKGGNPFGEDYFRELLERVRSIRASERRIWQQITDIYAECSTDYCRTADTTRDFYAMIQNKFHYAITGETAAEIVYKGADHAKPNMGLTTWKNAPRGRILKSDVTIAKNYLSIPDIRRLERAVTAYFDYIEGLIERHVTFTMKEFAESVNKFLSFNEYKILVGTGKVPRGVADEKAGREYDIFNRTQPVFSDFDAEIKRITDESSRRK